MKRIVLGLALGLGPTGTAAVAQVEGYFDVAVGKACWVAGYTNSAATWEAAFMNDDQPALVLRGAGTNFAPMQVVSGSARFDAEGEVKAAFKATYQGAEMNARVRFSNATINGDNGDPALFHTVVGGEDSTDDDWQDMIVNVTCLHHAG